MLSNEYISWRKSDRLLRGWIIGTLSEEALSIVVGVETTYDVLSIVVGVETTYDVWEALKKESLLFANR
jgi:hypothetical protein